MSTATAPKDHSPDVDPRSRLIGFSDVELELLTRKIADGIRPECGEALRTLRTKSGLTQTQAGNAIRRAVNTISDWECNKAWPQSNAHLPLLLQEYGVPSSIILKSFGSENIDETLSPRSYLRLDAVGITAIEGKFMNSNRGKMLHSLTRLALSGSPKHMEIWYARLRENEEEQLRNRSINSPINKPKLLQDRAMWMAQSVGQSPDPGQDSESKPDPGQDHAPESGSPVVDPNEPGV
jgi:transcriptional regulator with XRE-family HTH domain